MGAPCILVRICWSVMLAASIANASERILAEKMGPQIVSRSVAIRDERFDEDLVLRRSREFLDQNSTKKLIVYSLVPEEPAANRIDLGCFHCNPYDGWIQEYEEAVRDPFPMGEMVAVGQDAVVRYRSRSGEVHETVLRGKNPLELQVGTFAGKIIRVSAIAVLDEPRMVFISLFAVGSGKIPSKVGAKLVSEFAKRVGTNYVKLEFQPYSWFIEEGQVWLPLFEEHPGSPPTREAFREVEPPNCYYSGRPNKGQRSSCSWKRTLAIQ